MGPLLCHSQWQMIHLGEIMFRILPTLPFASLKICFPKVELSAKEPMRLSLGKTYNHDLGTSEASCQETNRKNRHHYPGRDITAIRMR